MGARLRDVLWPCLSLQGHGPRAVALSVSWLSQLQAKMESIVLLGGRTQQGLLKNDVGGINQKLPA